MLAELDLPLCYVTFYFYNPVNVWEVRSRAARVMCVQETYPLPTARRMIWVFPRSSRSQSSWTAMWESIWATTPSSHWCCLYSVLQPQYLLGFSWCFPLLRSSLLLHTASLLNVSHAAKNSLNSIFFFMKGVLQLHCTLFPIQFSCWLSEEPSCSVSSAALPWWPYGSPAC